jgi:23S rRNA (adenine2503-C2)-methyltransferase
MPVNKRYPLKELLAACRKYIAKTNRQVTFEYILIRGVNSSCADAQRLAEILKGMNCKVNLIAFNARANSEYAPPGKAEILLFQDVLQKLGILATIRKSRGQDIEAACGQLRLRYEKDN